MNSTIQIQTDGQVQFVPNRTAEERFRDDAIFLAQNKNIKLFNIIQYNTSFFGESIKSHNNMNLHLSMEKPGTSPLDFKCSGNVSYCQQLGGCCISYNCSLTNEQMRILYSEPCQQEVFKEAYKLLENTIPNYVNLFQLTFLPSRLYELRLLGLSVDVILLRVRKETPSQRNKFVYNAALLQLKMLNYNFVISPNLTQYYIKQFITTSPAIQQHNEGIEPQQPQRQIEEQPQPSTDIQSDGIGVMTQKSKHTVNASEILCDNINRVSRSSSPSSSSSSSSSAEESEIDEEENIENKKSQTNNSPMPIIVENLYEKSTFPNSKKIVSPKSLKSLTDTVSTRDYIGASTNSELSSNVNIIRAGRSETGLTKDFSNMYKQSCSTIKSTTGITDILDQIGISSSSSHASSPQHNSNSSYGDEYELNKEHLKSLFTTNITKFGKEFILDKSNRRVYLVEFLLLLDTPEVANEIYQYYDDIDENYIKEYINAKKQQFDVEDAVLDNVITEMNNNIFDRVKQAIYLYLLIHNLKY